MEAVGGSARWKRGRVHPSLRSGEAGDCGRGRGRAPLMGARTAQDRRQKKLPMVNSKTEDSS